MPSASSSSWAPAPAPPRRRWRPSSPGARRWAWCRCGSSSPSRPQELVAALPSTVRSIAVLDRCKEPGAVGEPFYLETVAAIDEAMDGGEAPFEVRAAHHRRSLRPLLQGVHAVDGQAHLRRARQGQAQAPLHGRHLRRRHQPQPAHRARLRAPTPGGRGAGHVLRPRLGRHRGRQQGLRQDHRRGHGPLQPGPLRVRLQEVGRRDRLAPALRPQGDPLDLRDRRRGLRGLPPVRPAGQDAGPRPRPEGRHVPPQLALRPRRGLGAAAGQGAAADRREGDRLLRHRCLRRGRRSGHGQPHQHRDAALLLQALRRAAGDGGHRRHQVLRREDLRQARREGGAAQLRRHRPLAGTPPQGARRDRQHGHHVGGACA